METIGKKLEIKRSNKRERTLTIEATYANGNTTLYRTERLEKEDFNYYVNYATENDLQGLMHTVEFEIIKETKKK